MEPSAAGPVVNFDDVAAVLAAEDGHTDKTLPVSGICLGKIVTLSLILEPFFTRMLHSPPTTT